MSVSKNENLISPADADKLIAAHDGDVALLYLFRLRAERGGSEDAARALCRTMGEIMAAEEKLQRMGLGQESDMAPAAYPAPAAEESVPQYSSADITRRCREDSAFTAILEEARKVMGKNLSTVDMKTIFGIYDYLGIPPDVLMLLINYCGRVFEEKYGQQRRPSAKAIQKEADTWARQEILTLEQAEEYISRQSERRSIMSEIRESLGIKNRVLAPTERDYVNSWLDMGFDEKCVAIAYDRTVTNTGSLKWNYMDKILHSWHEKGLHSPREILEKDGKRRAAAPAKGGKPMDFSGLDDMLNKI